MTRTPLRRSLALSSALGMSFVLFARPAAAQTVVAPGPNSTDGAAAEFNTTAPGQTINVTVNGQRTVLDWSKFNVPDGTTANFINNSIANTAVILNRVTGAATQGDPNTTTLGGTINAVNNLIPVTDVLGLNQSRGVEVWISNPNGVVMGPNGNFNTQGFVATTLKFSDAATVAFGAVPGGSVTLTAPNSPNAGITGSAGTIVTNGRVQAFIAPVIQLSSGTFDAGSGNIAFVTASDVTIANPGSPLAMTINAGTALNKTTGRALDLGGAVQAGNAYMVVSAQAAVDALLRVTANVTTASSNNGIIVLGGDNGGTAVGPITVAANAANSGSAELRVGGTLIANGGGSIGAGGTDIIELTGPLTTAGGGNVTVVNYGPVTASELVAVRGAVTSSGSFNVRGAVVTLGAGTDGRVQTAAGAVTLAAAGGALTIDSGVALTADNNNNGGALTLGAAGTTSISATGATLRAGADGEEQANVITATNTSALDLGNLVAGTIRQGIGTNAITNGLNRVGPINAGSLTLSETNSLVTTGAMTITGAVATERNLTLRADNGVTVGGAIFNFNGGNGDVAVSASSGAISLADTNLAGDLTLTAGSGGITFDDLAGTGQKLITSSGSIAGDSIRGAGAVTLTGGTGPTAVVTATGGIGASGAAVDQLTVTGGDATLGALFVTNQARFGQGTALRSLTVTGPTDAASIVSDTTLATDFQGSVLARNGAVDVAAGTSIEFDGAVNGPAALIVQAAPTSSVTFGGLVGSDQAFSTFTSTGAATVNVNGGGVRTTGTQSYGGLLALGQNAVLTGTGATFTGGVNGAGGGVDRDLTLNFSTNQTLTGSALINVRNVITDAAGGTTLSGALTTSGTQTFNDPITLSGATTLTSTGAGDIFLANTVNGTNSLTILTAAGVGFGGLVGGNTPLTTLTTSGAGATSLLAGSVTTTDAQTYGPIFLNGTGSVTLNAGAAPVSLTGLNGPRGLTVNTTGPTTLLGGGTTLGFITVAGGGTTFVSGALSTVGAQTYGGNLSLAGDSVLTATLVGVGVSVLGNGRDLTLNTSGAQTLGSSVTGVRDLTTDAAGTLLLNGAITTTGAQNFGEAVTLSSAVALTGAAVTFGGTVNGGETLAITAGTVRFNGDVGLGQTLTSLDVAGATTIGGAGTRSVRTAGAQTYGGALTLEADAALIGTGASFGGVIDGTLANRDLTLTFADPYSLPGSAFVNLGDLLINGAGATTLNGTVLTQGSQTYQSAVVLAVDTLLASLGAGAITLNAVSGTQALTVETSGTTSFNTGVTGLTSIATSAGGSTVLNGTISTSGAQSYGDDLTLASAVTVQSTGGAALSFGGAVNGAQTLVIDTAGLTTLSGPVGTATGAALTSLTSVGTGAVLANGGAITTVGEQSYAGELQLGSNLILTGTNGTFGGGLTGNGFDLTLDFSGPTTVAGGFAGINNFATGGGGTTTLSGLIETAGGQTYNDAVVLAGTTVLRSGTGNGTGAIRFGSTVDGDEALRITTAGQTSFAGAVGVAEPLLSVTVNGSGPVAIDGGAITTTGMQRFNGATTIGANTVLTTDGGDIAFGGSVDGPAQLSVRTSPGATPVTGAVTFAGATTVNGLAIRADTATLATTGNRVGTVAVQVNSGGFALADTAALTVGTVNGLSGIAAGGGALTLSAGGLLTLAADLNASAATLTGIGITQNAGTTANAGAGAITLDGQGGALTLAGTLTTTNAGAGAVRLLNGSTAQLGTIATGAGGTLTLGLTGAVTQAAGSTIAAGTLTGAAGGAATLTDANSIGTLGAFSADGLSLRSTGALNVTGPVNAGSGALSLRTDAGDLSLAGDLRAGSTVTLNAGGGIAQTGGVIGAPVLTGTAGGAVSLTGANQVSTLAGFTVANGGFALVDTQALAIGADLTVAGPLAITAAGIDFAGRTLSATGSATLAGQGGAVRGATLNTGGAIAVTGDSIELGAATGGAGTALTATGAVTVGTVTGATGSVLVRGTGASVTTASAGTTLTIEASAGNAALTTGSAGGSASVLASGVATVGTLGTTSAPVAGDVTITAGGGDAILGTAVASGAAALTAAGQARAGTLNGGSVTASGMSVDVGDTRSGSTLALTASAGSLRLGTGVAAGAATLSAASTLDATTLTAGGPASATAGGAATVGTIGGTAVTVTGTSAAVGQANASAGALTIRGTSGAVSLTGGSASGAATLQAGGPLSVATSLTAGGDVSLSAGGALNAGTVTSSGGAITARGLSATLTRADARTGLEVSASGGNVALTTGVAGGSATVDATGAITLGTLSSGGTALVTARGGNLSVATSLNAGSNATASAAGTATVAVITSANGAVAVTGTGVNVANAASRTTLDLTATAGDLALGTGNAGGAATLRATGALGSTNLTASGGAASLTAGTTLNSGTLNTGGAATLTATGNATLGQTNAGTAVTVTAGLISAGQTVAGTTLAMTSGGNLTLAGGSAGGNATLDANGLATLGQLVAGGASTLSVRAIDAAINGVQRAGTVSIANRSPASLKLGDGATAGGFALSVTEVNLFEANQLTLDGGTGNVEIGTLGFDADAGRTRVDVLATGRIDVTGAVSGAGGSRSFRFGGTAAGAGDRASVIRVVATPTAGGRLLFPDAALDLRGARIGVGQAPGFLDPIGFGGPGGLSVGEVAGTYIANPNSSLYNASLGGGAYAADSILVAARSLTVRFSSYALFQNTGVPGQNLGVALGSAASGPASGALVVQGPGSGTSSAFALFGTVGGVLDTSAAVLGANILSITGTDLSNSRINGCLVGSGAGCLTTTISQPLLAIFDASQVQVFRVGDDLAVPFDPVVGTNNESLFSGLGNIDSGVSDTECGPDASNPACGQAQELPQ